MIPWLLSLLPRSFTGRVGPKARQVVKSWTRNNATLRTLRYGWFRRLLFWSADHPAAFAVLMGIATGCLGYVIAGQNWCFLPHLAGPVLGRNFDGSAYSGVPWSVQATLVVLVYPIVFSFIALLLQRRAYSTVALRVYVLDSAIVPAGASSLGLLLVMGAEYFSAPYSSPSLLGMVFAPLLVMNGAWLGANLFLAGFFLSRTIRFIQEEEQSLAYSRVAVDVVLRAELTAALKQHLFVGAPYNDWGFPFPAANNVGQPEVQMFKTGDAVPAVRRDLKGSSVLYDVHLSLLKYVSNSWRRRAQAGQQSDTRRVATIYFPPMVGAIASGEVTLCAIERGPDLNWFERALVRAAFWYRPSRRGGLSLTTKRMLDEIAAEVESAAEQRHFGAAEEGLRKLTNLHVTLLLASAADSKGEAQNAATIGKSPYAWGPSTFDAEWLMPYVEVGRLAVEHMVEDQRLIRVLVNVPLRIAAELPARPENLLVNAMRVYTNLSHQLGGWWTKKADASVTPDSAAFNGVLPRPLDTVYERALIALIGGCGMFRVRLPDRTVTIQADMWAALSARALVYATHIESSADLFLKAASRGDETASVWFLDGFLKWWGGRKSELQYQGMEEYELPPQVTLTLAKMSWDDAQRLLSDWKEHVTLEAANRALNLAIRRYWEKMRLYLILVLVHNAATVQKADSRALRFAGALIGGQAQKRGGTVECWRLDTIDAVSAAILGTVFGVETDVGRIDSYAERRKWESEAPEVPGWMYGGFVSPTSLESMKRAQAILLTAVGTPRGLRIDTSKKLVERWRNDPDKLESVARHCDELRRLVLEGEFCSVDDAVLTLSAHLGAPVRVRSSRLAVARTMKELRNVANSERIVGLCGFEVDEQLVRRLCDEIAAYAFAPSGFPAELGINIAFVPSLNAEVQSFRFRDEKKRFISDGIRGQFDAGLAEHVAEYVRFHVLATLFERRVMDAGWSAVNPPELRDNDNATVGEMQTYVGSVAATCASLRESGIEPIVLVRRTAAGEYLQPHRWGNNASWQCPLPPGVNLRYADASKGERAAVMLNDVPVSDFYTPNGDCYVVPAAMFNTLEVAGSDAASALAIEWTQVSDEKLEFVVRWKAQFR